MIGKAFYVLFFVAVLLAVSWNLLADDAAKPVLMRLFVIALGLSLGCLAQQGIKDKAVSLGTGRSLIRRETNPVRFWGIVALNYGLALFLVAIGLFVSA